MRVGAKAWLWIGLAILIAALPARGAAPEPAALSASERAELKAQYDKLFAQLLARPTDLDLMFQFAAVAARLGNYEAAISTLERMLLINSDLPRVKLELGVIYFHIG